jgi:hypothetical protein
MKLKFIITAILITWVLPASADFVTVSEAREVEASRLTVPTSQNSQISFNDCDDCEMTTVRLTPDTQYRVDGRSVRFDAFRQAVIIAKQADSAGVILVHHLESDTVLSVSIIL